MNVNCAWEHNGEDTLLYAIDFVGAFARGDSLDAARRKMPSEIKSYLRWLGASADEDVCIVIAEEKASELAIRDADSDMIFESERTPLTAEKYERLKTLALQSSKDFRALYDSVPDKEKLLAPRRKTFYGETPCTAGEMYEHTKSVNAYYFAEIGVNADHNGDIYTCRKYGFDLLEKMPDFLAKAAVEGSYGEYWSLCKVLRRFLWHDRIHAKAMYRRAVAAFGKENVCNPFCF